jgi:hypothetical protein
MRTASRPALRAPPIDTVATGTPAGDDHLDAPVGGLLRVIEHSLRGPVRRVHPDLVGDVEFGQRIGGVGHHRPVAVAAHDHADT